MDKADDRKKRMMEHIARTTNSYELPQSVRSDERKQRILDHVRRSKG